MRKAESDLVHTKEALEAKEKEVDSLRATQVDLKEEFKSVLETLVERDKLIRILKEQNEAQRQQLEKWDYWRRSGPGK